MANSALCGAYARSGSADDDRPALGGSARAGGTSGSDTTGATSDRGSAARHTPPYTRRRSWSTLVVRRSSVEAAGAASAFCSYVRSARRWPSLDRRLCWSPPSPSPRIVEHPLLTVPLPAWRHEDHVLDLVDPLAALPFELLAGPHPMAGEPMIRGLRKHLRGRLQLFEIFGRLGMRRPFIGPAYGRRFGRRRIVRRWRHVLWDFVGGANIVSLRRFLRQARNRHTQSQRKHQQQSHRLFRPLSCDHVIQSTPMEMKAQFFFEPRSRAPQSDRVICQPYFLWSARSTDCFSASSSTIRPLPSCHGPLSRTADVALGDSDASSCGADA